MNREPFWWPMNEPPLPQDHGRMAADFDPRIDLQVDPSVTAIAANQARMAQIFHRIAKEDAELLERLADG